MCPKFDKVTTGDPLSYKLLSGAGYKVDKPAFFKKGVFNGTAVRDLIIRGDDSWKKLVPKQVVEYMREIDGEARLKNLSRR
jgi:nicotinamide-nucleotide adenylyltransferase